MSYVSQILNDRISLIFFNADVDNCPSGLRYFCIYVVTVIDVPVVVLLVFNVICLHNLLYYYYAFYNAYLQRTRLLCR